MVNQKIATVLIPNYKTLNLTKICLRLLKKNTDLKKVDIYVIDNNSKDESLNYLRSLKWITLFERKGIPNEGGPMSHARGLDLALKKVKTKYVISFHTDTFVINKEWLNFLLSPFSIPNVAGVGSWKLENKGKLKILGRKIEFYLKKLFHLKSNPQRFDKNYHYLRSHCAAYDVSAIKKVNSHFSDKNESAGKILHKKLSDAGYGMIFLEADELINYVHHINHATQAINSEFKIRTASRVLKKYFNYMNQKHIKAILDDDKLDH
jgi:cellulose synthase/poly-beta-1,6-N-acetylglucosamine synthase-like glycosyltransferase